ncbi:hypothetical protein BDV39DRAFT_199556 [Aspergillus sergii]|uniref:Uncharacterized protein n=1 Tax=Aspergillus sergii TaxID=1034303 RepID=A0A5N6XJV7_9EURO|nr:hypothetical protein BDV39DRAFT_199556 [Aspergillus sergii]
MPRTLVQIVRVNDGEVRIQDSFTIYTADSDRTSNGSPTVGALDVCSCCRCRPQPASLALWLPEPILFKACHRWLEVYCSRTYHEDVYPVRIAHELRFSIWIVSALTAVAITSRFCCQNQGYLGIPDFHFIVKDDLLGLSHVFYWIFSAPVWLPSSRTCVAGSFASFCALLPIFSFCVIKPEKEKSANSSRVKLPISSLLFSLVRSVTLTPQSTGGPSTVSLTRVQSSCSPVLKLRLVFSLSPCYTPVQYQMLEKLREESKVLPQVSSTSTLSLSLRTFNTWYACFLILFSMEDTS